MNLTLVDNMTKMSFIVKKYSFNALFKPMHIDRRYMTFLEKVRYMMSYSTYLFPLGDIPKMLLYTF